MVYQRDLKTSNDAKCGSPTAADRRAVDYNITYTRTEVWTCYTCIQDAYQCSYHRALQTHSDKCTEIRLVTRHKWQIHCNCEYQAHTQQYLQRCNTRTMTSKIGSRSGELPITCLHAHLHSGVRRCGSLSNHARSLWGCAGLAAHHKPGLAPHEYAGILRPRQKPMKHP